MKAAALNFIAAAIFSFSLSQSRAEPPEPRFRAVTIDDKVQIGYGVAVSDVDGDGKPDILLADKKQIVWYQNPGGALAEAGPWHKYVIAENLTERDNVCLAAEDLDGDGKCKLAVGADWDAGDTEHSGAVFYLIPPADRTQRWEPVKLTAEPTVHRMRWLRLEDGKWHLVVVPLHGRGNKNGAGEGVHVRVYDPPDGDPRGEWKTEVLGDSMHMTHNFAADGSGHGFFLAGREGVADWQHGRTGWKRTSAPFITETAGAAFKGIGELRPGHFPQLLFATVEPMHGNSLVCYSQSTETPNGEKWVRHLLTDELTEGHALACGDLLGMNQTQIVVGWRGNPQNPKSIGVHLWAPLDIEKGRWRDSALDKDGMACEDLQLADLNGDGKLDVVASGRSTHNLKIYINER